MDLAHPRTWAAAIDAARGDGLAVHVLRTLASEKATLALLEEHPEDRETLESFRVPLPALESVDGQRYVALRLALDALDVKERALVQNASRTATWAAAVALPIAVLTLGAAVAWALDRVALDARLLLPAAPSTMCALPTLLLASASAIWAMMRTRRDQGPRLDADDIAWRTAELRTARERTWEAQSAWMKPFVLTHPALGEGVARTPYR